MATTAGDTLEIAYTNAQVGSGVFYLKSGEDFTINYGGTDNSDDANNIDSSGQPIIVKNRRLGMFSGTVANDNSIREDYDRAIALKNSTATTSFVISHISGENYRMEQGFIVGEIDANLNAGTFELTVHGSEIKKL